MKCSCASQTLMLTHPNDGPSYSSFSKISFKNTLLKGEMQYSVVMFSLTQHPWFELPPVCHSKAPEHHKLSSISGYHQLQYLYHLTFLPPITHTCSHAQTHIFSTLLSIISEEKKSSEMDRDLQKNKSLENYFLLNSKYHQPLFQVLVHFNISLSK